MEELEAILQHRQYIAEPECKRIMTDCVIDAYSQNNARGIERMPTESA